MTGVSCGLTKYRVGHIITFRHPRRVSRNTAPAAPSAPAPNTAMSYTE